MHYPNYLLLGVAVVISRVVTRLGREVAKERELGSYRLGELSAEAAWARCTGPLTGCWPVPRPSS